MPEKPITAYLLILQPNPSTWCNVFAYWDLLLFFAAYCAPMAAGAHWHHCIQQTQMQNLHRNVANMTSSHSTGPTGDIGSLPPDKDPPTVQVSIGIWSFTWPIPSTPTKPPYDTKLSTMGKRPDAVITNLPLPVLMTTYCPLWPHHTETGTQPMLSQHHPGPSTNPTWKNLMLPSSTNPTTCSTVWLWPHHLQQKKYPTTLALSAPTASEKNLLRSP